MANITLDDRDRAVLERLCDAAADVETLADATGTDPESLRERLPDLADNGLVERAGDDVFAVTDSGRRTVVSSPAGTMDERIDTPPDVERAVESMDLPPDSAEALRNAFAFLRYWGAASVGEIVDAVYSENPAGFESRAAWWEEFLRDRLAALPSVESPGETGELWRFTETPTIETDAQDGRAVDESDATARASVRAALEGLDLSDEERAAVRAAFDRVVLEGAVDAAELREEVYPDHGAGYDSASAWWDDCVRPAFESLPGVERADVSGDSWEYRQTVEGGTSTDTGADGPE